MNRGAHCQMPEWIRVATANEEIFLNSCAICTVNTPSSVASR